MTSDPTKPDIEERYQTAGNTSNLTVASDCFGAGDMFIASGWSSLRVGMGLLRLHSEWDSCEKPTKPTKESIVALIGTFQRALPGEEDRRRPEGKPLRLTGGQAHHYAMTWYQHEMGILLGKLKVLPAVREQVALQALKWRMGESKDPITRSELTKIRQQDAQLVKDLQAAVQAAPDDEARAAAQVHLDAGLQRVAARRAAERREELEWATQKAGAVIRYWLDQTCGACNGLRWQPIPGTPALSNRICPACAGSGFGQVPHQQDGRRLANWMDSCVESARGHLRKNLSNRRRSRNKVVDVEGGYVIIAVRNGTDR